MSEWNKRSKNDYTYRRHYCTHHTFTSQGAFDLPRNAQVEVRGGEILKFEGFSYSGGAELTLDGVKGAILLPSALSIYGLKKLSVTNCSVASVYSNALGHRAPSYAR